MAHDNNLELNIEPVTYDVAAVDIAPLTVTRILAEGKTEANASAVVRFAVMRRGVDTETYHLVRAGSYHEGDEWRGAR